MRCQQRLRSNNQLVYSTRDMTVKSLNQMFSTTTQNNVSHVAYYYSDWIPSDNLEIGIVRNKHNGTSIDWDVVWAHNFNDNPPSIINISSSSNDVFVVWKDITSNYLKFIYDDQFPLAPQNLTVTKSPNNHPLLSWSKNNEADLIYYKLEKYAGVELGWVPVGQTANLSLEDPNESYCTAIPPAQCEAGHLVYYRVKACDVQLHISAPSNSVNTYVNGGIPQKIVGEHPVRPAIEYTLDQNYPNPFNPSTKISYSIKEEGLVTLKVYDVLGKELATLVNENKPEGNYEVDFNASQLPSGMYIYKLQAGSFSEVKKMLLTK